MYCLCHTNRCIFIPFSNVSSLKRLWNKTECFHPLKITASDVKKVSQIFMRGLLKQKQNQTYEKSQTQILEYSNDEIIDNLKTILIHIKHKQK